MYNGVLKALNDGEGQVLKLHYTYVFGNLVLARKQIELDTRLGEIFPIAPMIVGH